MTKSKPAIPDFYAWAKAQAAALRDRRFEALDITNLVEEIDALARRERRELHSRLMQVLVHLLMYRDRAGRRHSHRSEIMLAVERDAIETVLKGSPSLRADLPRTIAGAYPPAKQIAAKEMGIDDWWERWPSECPWTVEQILDPDFYPARETAAE